VLGHNSELDLGYLAWGVELHIAQWSCHADAQL
jgi:hypothetical protein